MGNMLQRSLLTIVCLHLLSADGIFVIGADLDVGHFEREPLSLVRVLAMPERYHNHTIRVSGVLSARYEGTALFLEEGSYKHRVAANAVWLAASKDSDLLRGIDKLEGKWVTIIGKFEADKHGAFGLFSGSIAVASFREILPK